MGQKKHLPFFPTPLLPKYSLSPSHPSSYFAFYAFHTPNQILHSTTGWIGETASRDGSKNGTCSQPLQPSLEAEGSPQANASFQRKKSLCRGLSRNPAEQGVTKKSQSRIWIAHRDWMLFPLVWFFAHLSCMNLSFLENVSHRLNFC